MQKLSRKWFLQQKFLQLIKVSKWKVLLNYLINIFLVITLAQCFICLEDAETYFQMFKYLGEAIQRRTGRPVLWRHLHGTGWSVATMDADKGQLKGKSFQSTIIVLNK